MQILKTLPMFVLLFSGISGYGIHFIEDFQGQTWGQYPTDTGTNYTSNEVTLAFAPGTQGSGGTWIGVVDAGSGSGRADPFGGVGNRSLAIHAYDTGTTIPRVNFRTPGISAGKISFDLYINPGGSQFHLFGTSGTSVSLPYYGFVINVNASGLRVTDGQSGGASNYVVVNSGFELGQAYNIEVEFFENSTYSIYLDGVIQSTSGGKDVFDFVNPQASLSQFQFTSAWGSTSNTTSYWIDNVTIIPEGATMGAMTGGLVLLLALLGWKRRVSCSKV